MNLPTHMHYVVLHIVGAPYTLRNLNCLGMDGRLTALMGTPGCS